METTLAFRELPKGFDADTDMLLRRAMALADGHETPEAAVELVQRFLRVADRLGGIIVTPLSLAVLLAASSLELTKPEAVAEEKPKRGKSAKATE